MIAQTIVQPVDMIKVRMQLYGIGSKKNKINSFNVIYKIIKNEGFLNLYRGLSCGLFRQGTYTTIRLGLYNEFLNICEKYNQNRNINNINNYSPTLFQKANCSLIAGGLGAIVGTPPDVAAVRMQSDGLLPKEKQSGYKNVFHALYKIINKEGFLYLWRGATPSIIRAMALNLGMLATYSHSKEIFQSKIKNQYQLELVSLSLSGFFASILSLPFDFIKTRLQRQRPDLNLSNNNQIIKPYKGIMDCFITVFKTEGFLTFYKGFPIYYLRIAPHAMLTLLISTSLNRVFS